MCLRLAVCFREHRREEKTNTLYYCKQIHYTSYNPLICMHQDALLLYENAIFCCILGEKNHIFLSTRNRLCCAHCMTSFKDFLLYRTWSCESSAILCYLIMFL